MEKINKILKEYGGAKINFKNNSFEISYSKKNGRIGLDEKVLIADYFLESCAFDVLSFTENNDGFVVTRKIQEEKRSKQTGEQKFVEYKTILDDVLSNDKKFSEMKTMEIESFSVDEENKLTIIMSNYEDKEIKAEVVFDSYFRLVHIDDEIHLVGYDKVDGVKETIIAKVENSIESKKVFDDGILGKMEGFGLEDIKHFWIENHNDIIWVITTEDPVINFLS